MEKHPYLVTLEFGDFYRRVVLAPHEKAAKEQFRSIIAQHRGMDKNNFRPKSLIAKPASLKDYDSKVLFFRNGICVYKKEKKQKPVVKELNLTVEDQAKVQIPSDHLRPFQLAFPI